jgi:phage baseplate assembly protein W
MAIYSGFTTQNSNRPRTTNSNYGVDGGAGSITQSLVVGKKYRLTDAPLVQQDLINAFSIRQGEKVGNPGYGTTLWSFIFEQNTPETQAAIQEEIRRVINLDPRINLNTIQSYPQSDGVLVELEIAYQPFNEATGLSLFFSRTSGTII